MPLHVRLNSAMVRLMEWLDANPDHPMWETVLEHMDCLSGYAIAERRKAGVPTYIRVGS